MITVNGTRRENLEGKTVTEFLEGEGYAPERIVVELNLEILSGERCRQVLLQDGDEMEIVQFVGGG